VPDHVQMAVGDGVEGAGIKRDAGHKPVYPARGGPASRAGSQGFPRLPAIYFAARSEPSRRLGRLLCKRVFHPQTGDETKLRPEETILANGESIRKPGVCIKG
jgi:hypothetical protein